MLHATNFYFSCFKHKMLSLAVRPLNFYSTFIHFHKVKKQIAQCVHHNFACNGARDFFHTLFDYHKMVLEAVCGHNLMNTRVI